MIHEFMIFSTMILATKMVIAENSGHHAPLYSGKMFPIETAKKDHFIMFYTTWCGHSLNLLPTWEELAERINGIESGQVRIAKVDCDRAYTTCEQNNINAYPTLKFFKAGTSTGIQFSGVRSLESLTTFMNKQMESVPIVTKTPISTIGIDLNQEINSEKIITSQI